MTTNNEPSVAELVEQLRGAYSTVFARSLAKRAADKLEFLERRCAETEARSEQRETLVRRSVTKDGNRWCICVDPENCSDRREVPLVSGGAVCCRATALQLPLPPERANEGKADGN